MKKIFTLVLMLAVVIGLSACGNSNDTAAPAGPDAEKLVKSTCVVCHGQNLEGNAIGPKLNDIGARLTKEEIATVIKEGKSGDIGVMQPGLLTNQADIDAVAEYLAAKK